MDRVEPNRFRQPTSEFGDADRKNHQTESNQSFGNSADVRILASDLLLIENLKSRATEKNDDRVQKQIDDVVNQSRLALLFGERLQIPRAFRNRHFTKSVDVHTFGNENCTKFSNKTKNVFLKILRKFSRNFAEEPKNSELWDENTFEL